jgi:hypothetical protein
VIADEPDQGEEQVTSLLVIRNDPIEGHEPAAVCEQVDDL